MKKMILIAPIIVLAAVLSYKQFVVHATADQKAVKHATFKEPVADVHALALGDSEYQQVKVEMVEALSKAAHSAMLLKPATELIKKYSAIEVKSFLGMEKNSTDISRRYALESILNRGAESDINFLFDFIVSAKAPSMSLDEWRAFIDNVVEYLVHEWSDQSALEYRLISIFDDEVVPLRTKTAILKQMDVLYDNASSPDGIAQRLWSSSKITHHDQAATALVTLTRLNAQSRISTEALSQAVLSILDKNQATTVTQVTALQIAIWLDAPGIEQIAKDIIYDESYSTAMQLAAINAFLKKEDLTQLQAMQHIAIFEDKNISQAVNRAIELLSDKKNIESKRQIN